MIKGALNFFASITTFCLPTRPVPQCPQGLNSNACGQMFQCPAGYEFSGLVGTSPIMQWIPSGRHFERVTARWHCSEVPLATFNLQRRWLFFEFSSNSPCSWWYSCNLGSQVQLCFFCNNVWKEGTHAKTFPIFSVFTFELLVQRFTKEQLSCQFDLCP